MIGGKGQIHARASGDGCAPMFAGFMIQKIGGQAARAVGGGPSMQTQTHQHHIRDRLIGPAGLPQQIGILRTKPNGPRQCIGPRQRGQKPPAFKPDITGFGPARLRGQGHQLAHQPRRGLDLGGNREVQKTFFGQNGRAMENLPDGLFQRAQDRIHRFAIGCGRSARAGQRRIPCDTCQITQRDRPCRNNKPFACGWPLIERSLQVLARDKGYRRLG